MSDQSISNQSMFFTISYLPSPQTLTILIEQRKNITISTLKPVTLLKVTLLHGYFSCFLSCANGTKSRKTSQNKKLIITHNVKFFGKVAKLLSAFRDF